MIGRTPGADVRPRAIRRVLITGIRGSGGSYLASYLLERHPDIEVHGIARWHSGAGCAGSSRITAHEADLTDLASTVRAVHGAEPDAIFHLAAHANVRASFDTPAAVLQNNIAGTVNLLEAVRLTGLKPLIQICSSSEVYGQVDPEHVPIKETAPMRPASPYAVSKAAQDLLGWSYFTSYGMPIVRTRMFTYLNPKREDLFATAFARQIARVELGMQPELRHGNLESVRTLLDVRDAMRAYHLALCWCEPGEAYNIGGTHTCTVGEVLDRLIGLARCPIPCRQDAALLRPADVTLQIPDTTRFTDATGWRPEVPVDQSLADLLDYWRERLRLSGGAPMPDL